MNSIKKLSILFLILSTMAFGNVNAEVNPTFNFNETQTLILELNDWRSADLTLEIFDSKGNIIYSDDIQKGETPSKEYDLNKLTVGDYYLVLFGKNKRSVNSFSIGIDEIKFNTKEKKGVFDPSIEISRRAIKLNYQAFNEDVMISIIGAKGVVHTSFLEGQSSIDQRINISRLDPGNYVFVLNSGSQNIVQGFKK